MCVRVCVCVCVCEFFFVASVQVDLFPCCSHSQSKGIADTRSCEAGSTDLVSLVLFQVQMISMRSVSCVVWLLVYTSVTRVVWYACLGQYGWLFILAKQDTCTCS